MNTTANPKGIGRAELASEWWTLAVRGVIAIGFGLVALAWPGPILVTLALLFGAYALADGILAAAAAYRVGRVGRRWWPLALEGVAGIVAGATSIVRSGLIALTLVAFIGAWALFTGVMEIVAAVRLRREIENEWLLGLAGVLSILLGLVAIAWPRASTLALVWVVGVYAILFGVTLVALGWRLRTWRALTSTPTSTAATHDAAGAPPVTARETPERAEISPGRAA